ncbi:MAG: hypothetical protein ABSB79_14855 [Syntrophales bacterium]|jgi:hypothetical protein
MGKLNRRQQKTSKKIISNTVKAKSDKERSNDPLSDKRKYRISLKSVKDVRRLLSISLNELRRGEIKPDIARATFYGCTVLLNCFEADLLEDRVQALEEVVKYRTN